MDILLLLAATFFNGGVSVAGALYARKTKSYNPFLYTACCALASCIFFIVYNGFRFRYDAYTMKLALLFALAYLICGVTGLYKAKTGPITIGNIFSSLSTMIPTFFGIIFWKESASWSFWTGIVFVCLSMVFMCLKPQAKNENEKTDATLRITPKWMVFVLIAFLSNGACAVIQTFHQKTGGADYKAEFMIIAMAVVVVTNLAISMATRQKIVTQLKHAYLGVIAGVMNAVVNLAVMLLTAYGLIPQSIFFPVISIGSMAVVYLSSLILFKEKLNLLQNLGVLFGVVAIVLLQL